ncbi:type VII secretion integral membrane protein EccD [Spirillospora sp. NBC_01491]|nr:type VII secretion integral membrane protein EccD [Actinomadura xylanilytica]MDL4772395.1 type VII secretion integral membrane protein EccD [Actinomadura xylanilytica]
MWSRVTLVGEQRRVDAVLPAGEPIGALMPDVLELLGDPVQHPARLRHLVTTTGEVLHGDATLAGRGIHDGAVLRMVRADEPLPAPVVHEVPEAVDGAIADHLWRWSPRAAEWAAGVATVGLALAFGLVLKDALGGTAGLAAASAAAVLLLVGGLAAGSLWRESLGTALTLAGGALGGVAVWSAADLHHWAGWGRWGALALLTGLLVTGLGSTSSLGRGGLIGGVQTVLLGLVWTACAGFGLDGARTGAVLAVLCVVLLNVMPRVALALSGLTSLDDRRSGGARVPRGDVLSALTGAHRSLVIATAAVAVAVVVAGWPAASGDHGSGPDGWTGALVVLLAVVVASRARLFPLMPQKAVLLAAALTVWGTLAYRWADGPSWSLIPALGMLLAPLVIPIVVLTAEPPEHLRARLRRITSRIEAVAVVALLPVAIGTFGVFSRLLDTF